MIHVLFVDDDISLLEGVRTMTYLAAPEWDLHLATGGHEALRILAERPIDVLVTDLKMPVMDGAELLAIAAEQYPDVTRILMSGNLDVAFTLQLVPDAQQVLLKPVEPSVLRSTVERSYELGRRLTNPELHRALREVADLPRPPESVTRLNALLEDPDVGVREVAEVVETDMALTAKVFQMVNSAYFGLVRSITDIGEAVSYVGIGTVRNLAVTVALQRAVTATSAVHAAVVAELHERANLVARMARQLVLVRDQANEAYVAGLLHDIGMLALVSYFPDRFTELEDACRRSSLSICDLEADIVGATHPDIGAYLLQQWGLPFTVVEAVARHHDAPRLPQRRMDPTHAVCIAEAIVSSQRHGRLLRGGVDDGLETAYLEELGVLERVAGLMAAEPGA